ncbi:hypothetical protein N752_08290 [Desulforamulus aquiferis]|nr:hypothetical protein N752_08290 [Desulforamulus aquiferis]
MNNISELFWQASLQDIKKGFLQQADEFICLICGRSFLDGVIYPSDGQLYEAKKLSISTSSRSISLHFTFSLIWIKN